MMEKVCKNTGLFMVYCLLGAAILLCGCGCDKKENFINTHSMPGHKMLDLLNKTSPQSIEMNSDKSPLTRTKSGLYIYKDKSVINTSGYNFYIKDKTDLGPREVRFDAEHFKTRY